jgi:hypothetical protein
MFLLYLLSDQHAQLWSCSCETLRSVCRQFVTNISGHPVGPIFKDESLFMDCLAFEDGADKLSRNVDKQLPK